MTVWRVALLIMGVAGPGLSWLHLRNDKDYHATPGVLQHVNDMPEVAQISGAGAHRGPHWYNYESTDSKDVSDEYSVSSDLTLNTEEEESKRSSGASSVETREKRIATRSYRECTPCALDMIRKHTNLGIKWICGAYQRARRSFKSECMMRYRNCQDGTMFIKISNLRCSEDPYHGRHWFYIYRV